MRPVVISMLTWISLVLLPGCYPGGAEFVEELDAVYTNYDPEFNFSTSYTYALPPGVADVGDESLNGSPEYIEENLGKTILNDLQENLSALGWTEVDEQEDPDLIILASAFSSTTFYYYDLSYWGGYYPGFTPGWGWYYPGYSPGAVSSYTTGTVILQMTVPGLINGNQVPVVWTATLNGLLQGSEQNIISRIATNIDQAFTQPPF